MVEHGPYSEIAQNFFLFLLQIANAGLFNELDLPPPLISPQRYICLPIIFVRGKKSCDSTHKASKCETT